MKAPFPLKIGAAWRLCALGLVVGSLGSLGSASAAVITWTASDDLYTRKSDDVVLQEDSNRVLVGVTQYGYLRFITGSTYSYSSLDNIESAVLRLYLPYSSGNYQSPALTMYATNILDEDDGWNDGGADPAVGEVFNPGLGTQIASTGVVGTNNPGIYFEWDVTSLVKSLDAGLGNNIMAFRLDVTGGTFRFAGTDHTSGFYPQLVITAIPEPSTAGLLFLGGAMLCRFRRLKAAHRSGRGV